MSGGYSGTRFTESAIAKISPTGMQVAHADFETALSAHPEAFAYLDPPYDVPNLYRTDPFDHERLAKVLRERSNWLLSYNDTPRIRALYEGWCEILPVSWAYGMNRSKQSNEVLIRRKW